MHITRGAATGRTSYCILIECTPIRAKAENKRYLNLTTCGSYYKVKAPNLQIIKLSLP